MKLEDFRNGELYLYQFSDHKCIIKFEGTPVITKNIKNCDHDLGQTYGAAHVAPFCRPLSIAEKALYS